MKNLSKNLKVKLQVFGGSLSSMIMPIIGIFIAWGLLTSFFIPTGWLPNEELATMVKIGITYIIPVLICYLGGYKIYKMRGGSIAGLVAIAAIAAGQSATFNQIIGTEGGAPMLLAVMIFGPLAALTLKHTEKYWISKIPAGFEMLINNFYLGILGFIMLFPVYYLSVYGVGYLIKGLGSITNAIGQWKIYPLVAIIVEPAKILFLNNAINHGVFTTLGIAEVEQTGKSILFLLESNPGPGLGLLLSYVIFNKDRNTKGQAASSVPIHLFGGIHEVYFPFALLKPILIIALIAGGMFGNAMFQTFGVGAVAPVSPGSVIAQYIQVDKSAMSIVGLTFGIFGSAVVTLLVSWLLIFASKIFKSKNSRKFEEVQNLVKKNKLGSKGETKISFEKIVFVCDAGMGSSVMGAAILRKEIQKANLTNIEVTNKSISNLDGKEAVIVTIETLEARVREKNPDSKIIAIKQFLNKSAYQEIIEEIKKV